MFLSPEDGFFNLFAGISGLAPALPVFGCPAWPKLSVFSDKGLINFDFYGDGGTKFQPVYVGDVADAVMTALRSPETAGKVFELGGPTVYTSKELMVLMLQTIGRRRLLLPLPFWLLTIMGFFMEALPRPLITRDQVKLLRRDNVVARRAKKLQDLGITPTAAEAVLPTYLARFKIHRSARAEALDRLSRTYHEIVLPVDFTLSIIEQEYRSSWPHKQLLPQASPPSGRPGRIYSVQAIKSICAQEVDGSTNSCKNNAAVIAPPKPESGALVISAVLPAISRRYAGHRKPP